ncbi:MULTISPECIES: winged helix-turn-helix transcriptional regulator [unclassified Sporosarcina]|uniref:winged helix-turn-helix transcriptional regulator n=1 Tax=unclassified Sporosarcina TaxID=2647733 RepID=UPI0009BE6E3A|nr:MULTISPECIES: helix-turn-helix domain-containing protein [unclassified Sporosarcina]ARD47266.1 transcriptional regulator [Sporosarcina sp. P33]PID17240.1 transcriptional regulator [Sporosarcina sp. P35]
MKKNEEFVQSVNPKGQKSCDSFHNTIEFIGKRWMGIIIYHLLDGPKRFFELSSEIDGISDRLLTERLRDLEAHGLVVKNQSDPTVRKVEYELTSKGRELEGIIQAVFEWVKKNGCCYKE